MGEFRASLEDIKLDLQERTQRWQHIEHICHFNIINNPGLQYLEVQLKRPGADVYLVNFV